MSMDDAIVIHDCTPAFADVLSGSVPRPELYAPGDDLVTWAQGTPALRRLGGSVFTLDELTAALAAAIGEPGHIVVTLDDDGTVRLVGLNVDGTRAAVLGVWTPADDRRGGAPVGGWQVG
jgi:hypothetical protein